MSYLEIRFMPLNTLITELAQARHNQDQELINMLALEIAYRVYIPFNNEKTYEELLLDLGYVDLYINKNKKMK